MKKNIDLDDTKPIEIINDEEIVGSGVVTTREEKYKDVNREDTKEAAEVRKKARDISWWIGWKNKN